MAGINLPIISKFDDKGVKQAQGAFDGIGSSLGKLAGIVATVFSARAIASFTKESVTAASNLGESVNAVNVAFGEAAESVLALGKNSATAMGVSQTAFNQAAVRFSAFAERVVGSGGDVAGFIGDISTRAADFASVFNIEVSEALQVFQSGLSGEAEPLKRFGINLLDSEVKAYALRTGLISVGETMTEQQKVQARYGLLMESTAKTAGDFANTSDGLANSQRILSASLENVRANIGAGLLPVFAEFTQALIPIAEQLGPALAVVFEEVGVLVRDQVLPAIQDFTTWLASPQGTQTIKDLAQALIDVLSGFFDFVAFVINNREVIANLALIIGGFTVAVKLATAATAIHTAALGLMSGANVTATATTGALGTALRLLPWAAVAIGVASLIQSFSDYADAVYGSKINTDGLSEAQIKQARRVEDLQRLLGQYYYALENGTEANKKLARDGIARVTAELEAMGIRANVAGAHIRDLNNISLGNIQREVFNASSHLKDLAGVAAQVAGATPPVFKTIGADIGDNLVKGMESKTQDVKAAAEKLAKATTPPGYEWVEGPNGRYLELSSFVSGQSDRGVGDFGAASASFMLRQQGLNQAEIDRVLTRTIGGTLDQVNATMNSGITLIDRASNRMIQGNLNDADIAEKVAQGFKVVEKIAAPIEELEKAISDLVSGIQGGQTAYLKPMAAGGLVTKPTPALVGEAGPEVVMPLDRFEAAMGFNEQIGSNYNISITAGIGSDPVSIGREVVNAIKRYESVSGKVFASA